MTSSAPTWLTPIIPLSAFDGDPEKYLNHLLSIFERDFIANKTLYGGKEVKFDSTDDAGKPAAFVHMTTEDAEGGGRQICLRRCERLEWIKAIIDNSADPAVLVWKKGQSTKKRYVTRTYLFLEREDFIVILEETRNGNFLITAIYVDYPHQKRKHLKDHEAYTKASEK